MNKTIVIFATVGILSIPTLSNAKDVCSDEYMASAIRNEANLAQNAVGICPTARAQIKLMKKSIALIDNCRHMPDLMQLRPQYVEILQQAQAQAKATCS